MVFVVTIDEDTSFSFVVKDPLASRGESAVRWSAVAV